jgi:hypothetical protein
MLKIQVKTMNYTEHIGEGSGDQPDTIKKMIKDGIGRLIDRCHNGKVEVTNDQNNCVFRIEMSETSVLEHYLGM